MHYIKRMICGRWEVAEEFMVPLNDVEQHQWYKLIRRMDRLMTVGHRCRGDVGVMISRLNVLTA